MSMDIKQLFYYYRDMDDEQRAIYEKNKSDYYALSSEDKETVKLVSSPMCKRYFETYYTDKIEGYEKVVGYAYCCDLYDLCGGISGWIIVLIIISVLLVLALAGVAFWFFYWRRKKGGRDVEDSAKSSTKSDYNISMGTY